jgi:hypothetical protein
VDGAVSSKAGNHLPGGILTNRFSFRVFALEILLPTDRPSQLSLYVKNLKANTGEFNLREMIGYLIDILE